MEDPNGALCRTRRIAEADSDLHRRSNRLSSGLQWMIGSIVGLSAAPSFRSAELKGEDSWVRYFGWCFLFKLAQCMSAIFPVLSRAKQRQKRLGAKPVLLRLRACRPTPARRAIHHLHPDGQTTTRGREFAPSASIYPDQLPTDNSGLNAFGLLPFCKSALWIASSRRMGRSASSSRTGRS
jgi:hypothetical protein